MVRTLLIAIVFGSLALSQNGRADDPKTVALTAEKAGKILKDDKKRVMLAPFVGEKGKKTGHTFRYDNLSKALESDENFKRLLRPALADWMRTQKMAGTADAMIRAMEQDAAEKDTSLFDVFRANALFQLEDGDAPSDRFTDAKEALAFLKAEQGKERGKNNFIIRRMDENGSGKPPAVTVIKK